MQILNWQHTVSKCLHVTRKCENRVCIVPGIEPGSPAWKASLLLLNLRHLRITHLPVSDVAWDVIKANVRVDRYAGR